MSGSNDDWQPVWHNRAAIGLVGFELKKGLNVSQSFDFIVSFPP